jgi:hypothetical protein
MDWKPWAAQTHAGVGPAALAKRRQILQKKRVIGAKVVRHWGGTRILAEIESS